MSFTSLLLAAAALWMAVNLSAVAFFWRKYRVAKRPRPPRLGESRSR